MSLFRPGGLELTGYALEKCGIKPGDAVLDFGCGDGTAVEYMVNDLGLKAKGIDPSKDMIVAGKERNPALELNIMHGCELPYPIHEFDAVTMECSLSVTDMQVEALHEAYCVLKPGGHLIISDVYLLHPAMGRAKKLRAAAIEESHRPREHGECETTHETPSPVCMDGAFVKPFLMEELKEVGFEVVEFEDKTPELQTWAAQAIFKYGSVEEMFKQEGGCNTCFSKLEDKRDTGYFLLIARRG